MICAVIHAKTSHTHVVDMGMTCLHLFVQKTSCNQLQLVINRNKLQRLVFSGPDAVLPISGTLATGCGCGCLIWKPQNRTGLDLETLVNSNKVKAITDWPVPQKLHDVQSFLSTMNFWWKFIPKSSHIAWPLNDLLHCDKPFDWTTAHQTAFNTLKTAITSEPVLKTPQRSLPFFLETDSSGFAISGILMQNHDNKFHPVKFYSCSLSPTEHNYPTLDQELLVIIKSLTHWCHFL